MTSIGPPSGCFSFPRAILLWFVFLFFFCLFVCFLFFDCLFGLPGYRETDPHPHTKKFAKASLFKRWVLKLAQITSYEKAELLNTKWIIILRCRSCNLSFFFCIIQLKKKTSVVGFLRDFLLHVDKVSLGWWSLEWFWRSTWYVVTLQSLPLQCTWTLPLHMWICLTAHTPHTCRSLRRTERNRKDVWDLGEILKQSNSRWSLLWASYLFAVMGVDFWETLRSSTLTITILSTMVQWWILIRYA